MARQFFGILLCAILVASFYAYNVDKMKTTAADAPAPQDMKRYEEKRLYKDVLTRGNFTFIKINKNLGLKYEWLESEDAVLTALYDWEKDNPQVEISHWHVQTGGGARYIGAWIHHKPKPSESLHQGKPPKGNGFRP